MYQQMTLLERLNIYYKKYPVTFIIITINTFMLLLTMMYTIFLSTDNGTIFSFDTITLYELGGMQPYAITHYYQFHRILTAMFLHGSLLHFLMNMYFLTIIGKFVERLLGKNKYILLYLLSGVGSGLLIWLMSYIFGNETAVTIGASGALFGLMGALLILTYKKPMLFGPVAIRSIRSLVVINLLITFIFPSISVFGHLGGFITGMLLIHILYPTNPKQKIYQSEQERHNAHYGHIIIDSDDVTDDDIYETKYTN